jgi:ABC-type transporter Mla subunit MlaD
MNKPTGVGADGDDTAGRIRRLTQAALNADVTIGRVDGVAHEIGTSLDEFARVLGRFDALLDKFADGLDTFAGTVRSVDGVVGSLTDPEQDLDELLLRVGRIVETVDWLLTPATAVRHRLSGIKLF